MKIVYCLDQIDHIGGTERVTIAKANALSEIDGNKVFIIIGFKRWENDSISLDSKIILINLHIPYYTNYGYNRIKSIWLYFKLKRLHRKRLRDELNAISPDIVLSVGGVEKQFLSSLKIASSPVFIREMHFHKNYRRIIAPNLFARFLAFLAESIDYHFYINRYDCISVLTQSDYNDNWSNSRKVVVIPNPIILEPGKVSSLENKVVISVGRLVETKNYSSLISAWKYVHKHHSDWTLEIYGDGPCRDALQHEIDDLNLSTCVSLCGFSTDIYSNLSNSSIFVFTSISEGFGLVIIEAMSQGLPVVAYDCQYGPRDIIEQGVSGYYVPINYEGDLAEKLILLIEDEKKRKEMGKNALKRAMDFSMDKIVEMWMATFSKLLENKR